VSDIDVGIPGIADVVEVARSTAYTTYRVTDTGSGRQVLIKVVHAAGRPPSVVARFGAEQDVLVELASHPNLVSVYGHGTTSGGEEFVVTEMTSATTAADRAAAPPPMTGPEVLRLGVRAAGALESVHRGGVVHGDLRATNVVLGDNGEPGVTDVGLVTLTGASIAATGDPRDLEHASPEQLDGQYLTPATDQYSLAATLYRLLAGEAAFVRPSDTSVVPVIKRIATDPPADLKGKGVPAAAADVVHKALSKTPAERYPSMQAFGRALQQAEVALGLPITDLTVMTPDTRLPTVWDAAPAVPPPPPAAAASGPPTAKGPPSGGPPAGGPPSGGPPASAASKSRTPLFIGIGVALVVVLIAAVLLTRGGSDKKNAASSVTTTTAKRRATTTSTASSDVATDFAPAGFVTVNEAFDNGEVEVFVPSDWTDVFPVQLNNGEPRLRVAPSVDQFIDGTFTHPGVQIDVFGVEANGLNNPDNLDALLDHFMTQPPESDGVAGGPAADVCTPQERGSYPDGLGTTSDGQFTGRFQRLTGCRGAGSVLIIFATPADKSFIVQIVMQTITPEDEAAVPVVVGSILVGSFS
jgi:serine/threonine protein kinase